MPTLQNQSASSGLPSQGHVEPAISITPQDIIPFGWIALVIFSLILVAKLPTIIQRIRHLNNSSDKLVYILIAVVSLLCLILATELDRSGWSAYLRLTMEGIGSSGIVALILIYTVEAFTRRDHHSAAQQTVDRIKKDLFHSIYHRYIPPEVFHQIEKGVMNSNVYRTDYEIDYNLVEFSDEAKEELPGGDKHKYLQCIVKTRYDIRNITDSEIKQKIELHIEYPLEKTLKKYVEVTALFVDHNEVDISPLLPDKDKDTNSTYKFEHSITIPANSKASILLHHRAVKCDTDMEVWASRMPSNGMNFTVNFPDSISVEASANHVEALIEVKSPVSNERQWQLPYGVLPFQSVVFWWSRNSLIEQSVLPLELDEEQNDGKVVN